MHLFSAQEKAPRMLGARATTRDRRSQMSQEIVPQAFSSEEFGAISRTNKVTGKGQRYRTAVA